MLRPLSGKVSTRCDELLSILAYEIAVAPDDASPIAVKKSKSVKEDGRPKKVKADKKTSKSRRSTDAVEKEDDGANGEADGSQVLDDEDENAQALAKAVDSDEEDDAVVDTEAAFQEGGDVGEIPKTSKKLLKSANPEDDERGVVYIGRLPRKSTNLLHVFSSNVNLECNRRFLRA